LCSLISLNKKNKKKQLCQTKREEQETETAKNSNSSKREIPRLTIMGEGKKKGTDATTGKKKEARKLSKNIGREEPRQTDKRRYKEREGFYLSAPIKDKERRSREEESDLDLSQKRTIPSREGEGREERKIGRGQKSPTSRPHSGHLRPEETEEANFRKRHLGKNAPGKGKREKQITCAQLSINHRKRRRGGVDATRKGTVERQF